MATQNHHQQRSRFSLGEISNEGLTGAVVAVSQKRKRDSSICKFAGVAKSNYPIAQPQPLTFSKEPKSRRSINLCPKPQKENQEATTSNVTFKPLPPRRRQGKSLLAEGLAEEESDENEQKKRASKLLNELKSQIRLILGGLMPNEIRGVDDFRILEKLGEGSFSMVQLVQDKATRSMYALKILDKKYLKEEKLEDRLAEQIKIQSFLNHSNIVKLYGTFSDKDYVYLIQQYAGKNSLYDLMKYREKTGFTTVEVAHIVGQLCQAVKHLHSYSIIHRDIKPENILLYDDLLLKLSDFGWSVYNPDQSLRKTFCGTPLYLSPEILTEGVYDEGVDLWAIGVLTYELLTGKLPFNIKKSEDLRNIVTEEVDSRQIKDPLARSFVKELLIKNWKQRKPIDQICQHPFLQARVNRIGR